MFSDDLDDKIAQILRGNFSPAKNIVPPTKLATPVVNNVNAINSLVSSLNDNNNPKTGITSSNEIPRPISAPIKAAQEPLSVVDVKNKSSELLAERKQEPTHLISPIENISNVIEKATVTERRSTKEQVRSTSSSTHSIDYQQVDRNDETIAPSNDISAMIARLKNHSRDPSPSNSSRESPSVPIINEPNVQIIENKQVEIVNDSKNLYTSTTTKSSGIAAYESPLRDSSASTVGGGLADESVVDDLLFGGGEEDSMEEESNEIRNNYNNRPAHSTNKSIVSQSPANKQSVPVSSSQQSQQSRQSPVKAQSTNSPLFRNFERPSLQMTQQADDTLDLETSMDSTGLYDISGTVDSSFHLEGEEALISDVEEDEAEEEESDRSMDSAVEVVSNASALQLQQPSQKAPAPVVEEEVSLTPIQIIMQQQQRLMQQQQQRQQSPLKEVVSISRKASTSPSPVLRQVPPQQVAPRSKSPLNPARSSVEASKPQVAASPSPTVKSVPRKELITTAPRVTPAVEVRSVVRNVAPSTVDEDTVPPVSSSKLVVNSPANPADRRSVPLVVESPPQAKPISPLVRMEQVYQYAENDEEEQEKEKVVPSEKKRATMSRGPQEAVAKTAPPSSASKTSTVAPPPVSKVTSMAPPQARRAPVESVVTAARQPRQDASPERFTANPLKGPSSVSTEAATMRVALARAASETEPVKKGAPAARPVSAARARPSGEGQQSPLKIAAPSSKESPDSCLTVNQNHSPSRGPLIERPVKVAVRVRPFTTTELAEGARRTISRNGEKIIIVNPKAFDAEPDTIAAAAVAMDNKQWAQIFQYNHFLWARDRSDPSPPTEQKQYVNQEDVHDSIGREIVESVLHGVSASCFAYGHTSTGKTHSLFGNVVGNHSHRASSSRSTTPMKGQGNQAALALAATSVTSITSESGLIPRVMFDIVSAVNSRDMFGSDTRMFFSFVEIYNEKIIDLLVSDAAMLETTRLGNSDTGASVAASALKAREHPVLGTYVENLNKVEVSSPEEVLRLIARGQSNRATTCTAWNTTSSRSHAIVTLELSPANYSHNVKFISPSSKNNDKFNPHSASSAMAGSDPHQHLFTRVQMVDLAGSEKDSNWGSGSNSTGHDEHGIWKGSRYNDTTPNKQAEATADKEKNELKLIRRSLSTLGYIIKALAKGAAFKSLPYRDSVLTFLLRDALNGHNHTTMLATISPADNCYEETLSTLRYAEKLCSLRGIHHHAHHGLPGGSHHMNVSYGSPVTSLVASDKDMIQSRKALLEEFGRIHDGLGHNRPGSNASRQLHKQTISDPQQRIAKMTKLVYNTEVMHGELHGARDDMVQQDVGISASSSGMSTPNGKNRRLQQQHSVSFTSPVDGSSKDIYSLTTSDLDALKSSYRALQGQLIETQIDVESVKADRDTLTVDLKIAREQLLAVEQTKSDSRSTIASLTRSFKAAEKEINEYRVLLRKKEESLERVVGEISSEKQGRLDAEHAYHARTKEFLSRFESMKKENKNLSSSLEVMSNKYKGFGDEKKDLLAQIDKLRAVVKTLTSDKDALVNKNQSLSSECELLKGQLHNLTAGSATELSDYERANAELMLLIGRLQAGLGAVTAERDDLERIVRQKEEVLSAQSLQAEDTIRLLQQRQAAQDRNVQTATEVAAAVHNEDFGRLHESLRELFTSEGQVLHSELLDTKKLIAMIRDLRQKMLQHDSLQDLLHREKSVNQKLHAKFLEFRTASEQHAEEVRVKMAAQHDYLQSQLEEARTNIATLTAERQHQQQSALSTPGPPVQFAHNSFGPYPHASPQTYSQAQSLPHMFTSSFQENNISNTSVNSHLHSSTVSMNNNALEVQLRTECNLLREQLVQSQTECNRAKEEARVALDSQHKEQASLWASMQEANRDMAAKDLALHDLAAERDRALHERDALAERLRLVSTECSELQQDLRELDADLVAAVEMTTVGGGGRMQGGGLALHKVPDRMMHGIMRRREKLQQTGAEPSIGTHFDIQQQQQQQFHHQQSTSYAPAAAPSHFQQSGPSFDPHKNGEQHFSGQRSTFPSQPQQTQHHFQDSNFTFGEPSGGAWDEQYTSQSHRHTSQRLHSQQHQHQQSSSSSFGPQHAQSRGGAPEPSPHSVQHSAQFTQPHPQQQQRGNENTNLSSVRANNTHQQRVSPSTTLRSSASSNISAQHEDEQQYDLSEKILQRQIEELSDFLDDEAKLKRSRLQRGSNGSLSSLAQSNATKRTKLYTPTTKLNFDF